MNGTAETAEKFRRYPMSWIIMACVFSRIPLISLAKSLSDRRFIPILQQTLKEISTPPNAALDVEMVDAGAEKPSKKRKRSTAATFDLESLRGSHESLETADALFRALHILLGRLDPVEADAPTNVRMGSEHVKSLFYSPAKEAVELLLPILLICDLALQQQESEPFEDQASWAAVFTSLWDLHIQNSGDAVQVATSLYSTGCGVLAKMERSKDLILDPHVKARWTRDLRRFFTKSMILPARAAFLNRKDMEIIETAVEVTMSTPTAANPVLFSLAVKTPHSTEDAGARKNYEDWTQKVFDIIEEPIREADPLRRNQAMQVILDTALEGKGSISLGSLRTVCKTYSNTSGKMDLNIVTRIANLDVDAFLISNEGHALLDMIVQQVSDLSNAELQSSVEVQPVDLIVSLAKGFAKGRDLPGFIKKWHEALTACLKKGADYSDISDAWSCEALTTTVSGLLQSSVNTKQLLTLLEWLNSQEATTQSQALLIILDAISQGITKEDFVDAVNLRIYEMICDMKIKSMDDLTKARWWHIVESTVHRSTLEQCDSIWTKVESDLKKALKKGEINDLATSAAFSCSSRLWLANYQGGPRESKAAALTCSFLKKLEDHKRKLATEDGFSELKFFESPRLVDMLVKSDAGKEYLSTVLERVGTSDLRSFQTQNTAYNEASLNNHKYINGLVLHAIDIFAQEQTQGLSWDAERVSTAAQILLHIPSEAITREHREQIMPKALYFTSNPSKKLMEGVNPLDNIIGLMVKVSKRPTFYEAMAFADLVTVGDSILTSIQASIGGTNPPSLSSTYNTLKLFEALATNTLRQMTSNLEKRERVYLADAATTVASWPANTTLLQPHRFFLLRSFIISLEASKMAQESREVADTASLKECASLLFAPNLNADHFFGATDEIKWHEGGLTTWSILFSYDQVDVIEPSIIRGTLTTARTRFERLSETLCSEGWRAGWRMKELLFTCLGEAVNEPLNIKSSDVLSSPGAEDLVPLCMRADAGDINRYLGVVLKGMSAESRDRYFASIPARLHDDEDITGHLLALNRLLSTDNGMSNLKTQSRRQRINEHFIPVLRASLDKIDLAKVHSVLSTRLAKSQTSPEFLLIAQTMHTLLDKKASSMKQWNTEVTLSTVSIIAVSGAVTALDVQTSPKTYDWLYRLVEVIIKRHRLRLEGHFHLLVTTLQALLQRLLVPSTTTSSSSPSSEKQAKHFTRLLTLICEPSVASVTRGQQPGALDSAVDAAKRSAGQHLYLVLMLYIKLQLEHAVPRAVRDALEPGVNSVLDITSQGGRRILNEAVDGSGRAVFREMYRRYVKFGKWSGV